MYISESTVARGLHGRSKAKIAVGFIFQIYPMGRNSGERAVTDLKEVHTKTFLRASGLCRYTIVRYSRL